MVEWFDFSLSIFSHLIFALWGESQAKNRNIGFKRSEILNGNFSNLHLAAQYSSIKKTKTM